MHNSSIKNIPDILEQARILAEQNKPDAVGRVLADGVELHPGSTDLMAHLGHHYAERGRIGKAIEVLERRNHFIEPDQGVCQILAEQYAKHHDSASERKWLRTAKAKGYAAPGMHKRLFKTYMHDCFRLFKQLLKVPLQTKPGLCVIRSINWIEERISYSLVRIFEIICDKAVFQVDEDKSFVLSGLLRFCKRYDSFYVRDGLAYHKTREIMLASSMLPINDSKYTILDIGAGFNTASLFWSMQGAAAIALDGSTYGFSHLKKVESQVKNDGRAININYAVGDGTQLPLAENVIDGASVLCMLEHIPEDGDIYCMQELFRVIRPGGLAVVTVETNQYGCDGWLEAPYSIGFQSGKDVEAMGRKEWNEVYCRNYSPQDMVQRLGLSAPWETVQSGFYDDGFLPFRKWLSPSHPITSAMLRHIQPWLSLLFYRKVKKVDNLSPSSIGYLVLRKPL
jgi:ubiquinone/menaquinone biosynthesis C-methylase UbiE